MIDNRVKRIKFLIYRFCVATVLSLFQTEAGAHPFQNCIYPTDYNGADQTEIIVSGGEIPCAEQCTDDCTAAFSNITYYGESAADIIDDCIASCKNGVSFTKAYRTSSTDFPLWKSSNKSATVKSGCKAFPQKGSGFAMLNEASGTYVIQYSTDNSTGDNVVDNFYYVVNSGIPITSDEITINLVDGNYAEGFMCGTQSSYLWPTVGTQGTDTSMGSASKIGLQTSPSWDTTSSDNSDLSYWNVRNKNWISFPYDSNISAQNGDYLSITYSGNYCQSTNCSMDISPPNTLPTVGSTDTYGYDRGLLMLLPDDTTAYNFPGNSMTIPSCSTDAEGNTVCPTSSCTPSFDDNGNPSCQTSGLITSSDATFGLSGSYYVSQVEIGNQGKQPVNVISFSGILRNFSDDGVDLAFKHNDAMSSTATTSTSAKGCYSSNYSHRSRCQKNLSRVDCCCKYDRDDCGAFGVDSKGLTRKVITSYSSINQFADNTGGLIVRVDWKGCYFNRQNQIIQYALMPFSSMDTLNVNDYRGLVWNNASLSNPFKISGSGMLMFRLKPQGAGLPSQVGGGYSISVKKSATSSRVFGLNSVVETINKQLFGSSISSSKISDTIDNVTNSSGISSNVRATPGIVQNIFTYLTQEPAFISAIRAALFLYIAYMGLAFMIGLSPINQKEALTILLKLGIMATLISGQSWDFFNRYLFNAVIQGSADLMSVMIMNYDEYNSISSGSQAANLFSFLDPILLQLFSNTIWIKMIAIFLSGISAWVSAILLFLSVVLFIIFLFRVVMLYITSMIALSILTIVAPIFISFMLFQYTHNMFMGWLKQYISFAVQPILVVSLASIMAKLIVFLLNSNLYFTVCKTCLIGWSIGSKNFCLLPSYMTLPALFGIDVGSINSPVLSFESLMILYLVVNSANALCSHLSGLAAEIVTGSMMSMNLANASPSSPLEVYGNLKNMIGMSDPAIAGRAAIGKMGRSLGSFLQQNTTRNRQSQPGSQPQASRPNPQIPQNGIQNVIQPQQMFGAPLQVNQQNGPLPLNPNIPPVAGDANQVQNQPSVGGVNIGVSEPAQNIGRIAEGNFGLGSQNIGGIAGGNVGLGADQNIGGIARGGIGILENIGGNENNPQGPPAGDQNEGGGNNE